MEPPPRKVPVVFYQTPAGSEIVRDWLKGLAEADRAVIGQDLMRVQFRWPVGMPLCRPLGDGLWEVRSDLSRHRIARVFFCFTEGRLVALNGISRRPRRRRRRIWS
jgi:hypothetical protein